MRIVCFCLGLILLAGQAWAAPSRSDAVRFWLMEARREVGEVFELEDRRSFGHQLRILRLLRKAGMKAEANAWSEAVKDRIETWAVKNGPQEIESEFVGLAKEMAASGREKKALTMIRYVSAVPTDITVDRYPRAERLVLRAALLRQAGFTKEAEQDRTESQTMAEAWLKELQVTKDKKALKDASWVLFIYQKLLLHDVRFKQEEHIETLLTGLQAAWRLDPAEDPPEGYAGALEAAAGGLTSVGARFVQESSLEHHSEDACFHLAFLAQVVITMRGAGPLWFALRKRCGCPFKEIRAALDEALQQGGDEASVWLYLDQYPAESRVALLCRGAEAQPQRSAVYLARADSALATIRDNDLRLEAWHRIVISLIRSGRLGEALKRLGTKTLSDEHWREVQLEVHLALADQFL